MNKETLNDNTLFQEILEENKQIKKKVTEEQDKSNYQITTNKNLIDKNSQIEQELKTNKNDLIENQVNNRMMKENNEILNQKLTMLENKLTKDFLS